MKVEEEGRAPTLWIELQHVDVAIRVCGNDVQLLSIWQEIGGDGFDMFRRFAKEAQLIWIFRVPREPYALDRIAHDTQSSAFELFGGTDIALHVHEGHWQQRPVLFQASDHAFLTLCSEQEALRADLGKGRYRSFDFFFGDQFQLLTGFGTIGFGNDVDDVEDVDSTYGG